MAWIDAFFGAISTHDGWSMAFSGAAIVLSGLTVLALILSQLHKIVAIIERRDIKETHAVEESTAASPLPLFPETDRCPADITDTANLYRPLAQTLGDQFQLAELYALANQHRFPHPHLTIRCLREAGKLIPMGDGEFRLAQ